MDMVERLPDALLRQAVTAEHLWHAAGDLLAGVEHPYGPARDFEAVLGDGQRLPPVALYALAAARALGRDIAPGEIVPGPGNPAFDTIKAAGMQLVLRGTARKWREPLTVEDRIWAGPSRARITHLILERGLGLRAAKLAQVTRMYGRATCSACGCDPVAQHGPAGLAALQVHVVGGRDHFLVPLDALRCLCANCHAVAHDSLF
ncbi:hypothetical protein ACX9MO_09510 [Pseudooceanicola sp. 502str34]